MDIVNFINTVGFPIFVAVYFLVRLDNTLKDISKNIIDLTKIIELTVNKEN
ncbi:YvrJ family protein [Gemelliphila palaticanis]|uniref:YvrJ family protein n=1 Tax=Gemelliphila palaticanis TaxID=81950 RepID=A0ABX2T436_9BACL|nr:YvrJ family protein [Gemella palaticanis]MBF0716065.1 YvrJ family protein [Gemella palaticanis]NYS47995.1 YvrJ family protein [Gemella palaticanis]